MAQSAFHSVPLPAITRRKESKNQFADFILLPLLRSTTLHRNYWHNYEKRCCVISHKQLKTLLRDNMVKLKIISIYIYKERLRILGLMSHVTIITWMAT